MYEGKRSAPVKKPSLLDRLKGIGTMNLILVIVAFLLICFTIKMISTFEMYGAIPDTLCTCVFAVLGGECGVMGWIKTTKEKNKNREQELEDRKHNEAKMGGGCEPPPEDETIGG